MKQAGLFYVIVWNENVAAGLLFHLCGAFFLRSSNTDE